MWIALLATVLAAAPADLLMTDAQHGWIPDAGLVRRIEARLKVPERMGGPLTNFDRYYTGIFRNGRRVVFLELVNLARRTPGQGAVHVVAPPDVPAIADGGCAVVRFSYDVETRVASSLECNSDNPPPPPAR